MATAIEFSNESWYIGETTELLNEYEATMVLHDFSKGKNSTMVGNANFVYLRFHGPIGNYRESYCEHALDEKAELIKELQLSGKMCMSISIIPPAMRLKMQGIFNRR